jgi:hypothetical protein
MGIMWTKPPSLAGAMAMGPPGPLRYEEQYRRLPVDAGAAGQFFVDIHLYRNTNLKSRDHETTTAWNEALMPLLRTLREESRKDQGLEERPKEQLLALRRPDDDPRRLVYRADGEYEFIDTESVHRTFVGKGSPPDIQLSLRLAIRYGKVAADATSVQTYCDKYIGMDCSGFVSNYANATLGKHYDVMNNEAMSFRQPPSARRSAMLSIQPLDVLAWAADNHVAIIHSVKQGYLETAVARQFGGDVTGLECTVVEANLTQGLHHSTYRVISVGTDRVFTVKRENGTTHRVYILPLP